MLDYLIQSEKIFFCINSFWNIVYSVHTGQIQANQVAVTLKKSFAQSIITYHTSAVLPSSKRMLPPDENSNCKKRFVHLDH